MNLAQVYPWLPVLNPPPSSLPIPSLWAVPVHQPQASSIVHRTWTGSSSHTWYYTCFNAILPSLPTLSLSHRVHKTDLYISVSPLSLFTVFPNRTPWKAYPFCLDLISLLLTPSSPPQPTFCLYQTYQDSPRGATELRPPRTGPFDETGHSLFCEILGVASRTHSGECSSAYSYGRFVLIPPQLPDTLCPEPGLASSLCLHPLFSLISCITFCVLMTLRSRVSGSALARLPVLATWSTSLKDLYSALSMVTRPNWPLSSPKLPLIFHHKLVSHVFFLISGQNLIFDFGLSHSASNPSTNAMVLS